MQLFSGGGSTDAIHRAALAAARPRAGLSWIDIGVGTGEMLHKISDRWAPASLVGVDLIDWLSDDLEGVVNFHLGDAHEVLPALEPADRVLAIESIEHFEAPWLTLRLAARLVKPGGRMVLSTPSLTTLRHRLELGCRGRLTSFRPEALQHLTPALPHVSAMILAGEGLRDVRHEHVGRDVIPLSGGRLWPRRLASRFPELLNISVMTSANRPVIG